VTHTTDLGTASNLPVDVSIPGYRLRRQVGTDAVGLWFDAEQESLERKVTVKVLKPQYESHEPARREFLAEMDRLAVIDHPNLVRVLDSSREGTLWLVTERIGFNTLANELAPGKPLGEKASLSHARAVARALQHLVSKGLGHKNVTPRLVSVSSDGACRLVTFRNVLPLADLAALRGKLAQDPHYVAPEQLVGPGEIGERTHAYHVGALLFHLLAGRAPHTGGVPAEIAKAHLTDDFPSLKRFQPFLKSGTYDFVAACTQRDPESRPDLARVCDALEKLIAGNDPGLADVTPPPKFTAPRPRRRRRRR